MEEIIVLTSHKPKFPLSWPSLSEIIPPESLVIWRPCGQANWGYKIQESSFKDVSDASWEMQNQWLKTFKDGIDK